MPKKSKKLKPYLPTEKEVEKGCIDLLKSLGFGVYKTSTPRVPIGVTSGLPDLLIFNPTSKPAFWFLEVKRMVSKKRKTKLRPSQIAFKKLCEESGVPYRVFHSTEELWDWLVKEGFITESRS